MQTLTAVGRHRGNPDCGVPAFFIVGSVCNPLLKLVNCQLRMFRGRGAHRAHTSRSGWVCLTVTVPCCSDFFSSHWTDGGWDSHCPSWPSNLQPSMDIRRLDRYQISLKYSQALKLVYWSSLVAAFCSSIIAHCCLAAHFKIFALLASKLSSQTVSVPVKLKVWLPSPLLLGMVVLFWAWQVSNTQSMPSFWGG